MRIAIFSEVYWPMVSGVGVTLRRLAEALVERGHVVRVYSPSYPLPGGQSDRAEVHRSSSVPLFLYPDVQWAFPRYKSVLQDVARFQPDIIHVATEFAMGVTGAKIARQLGIPVVASAHTDYEKYASRYNLDWFMRAGWRYLRWFYRQTSSVLCPSTFYRNHLISRGVTNTGIWSRGVDADRFHPMHRREEYRRALGVNPGDTLVTYVGRIAREKDLDLLVQAWQRLAPGEHARLALVGRGPLEGELKRLNVPGVVLAGMKHDGELSAAYASSDVFVLPSTTETFGNVLLEGMASALPCLAVSTGGVMEFARHESNAWLVEPHSADALAQGLETLLGNRELRHHLGTGARRTALARGWEPVFDSLLHEYSRAGEGTRHQAA
jgi:glycosyltransferase involved in cell wall biosynthesis